ncbi:MAG: MFS transporter [Deltaproteobacteria bacterium]|nr:MFS transporter [Deltaproteobacteria bacterium]
MADNGQRIERIKTVMRVTTGNFLEMYDFIVYSYYAKYIGQVFFPSVSEFASLMASFLTFGVGFLMRPVGALVLGAYIDRHGRSKGLILTLGLMAVGICAIAVTPGYNQIGVLAPIIVVCGRLLQGLSAGVELGGVSVYLAEIATPGNRGFYCSWQSGSQQVAVMFTAIIGVSLTFALTAQQLAEWGWRIPMIIGCAIVPLIFWLRRSLKETKVFSSRKHHPKGREILRILASNWRLAFIGMMLSTMTTTAFYTITAYTPTYGHEALNLAVRDNLIVTLCVGLSNFIWLPIGGAISDRIGRRPLLILMPLLAILTAYPAMLWLVAAPSFGKLLLVLLWFSFFYGAYNGAMIPFLTEIMPPEVRTAGFSLAYSLATAIFGGFTPAVCVWLIEVSGNRASPALWLSSGAAISLIAAFLSWRLAEKARSLDTIS